MWGMSSLKRSSISKLVTPFTLTQVFLVKAVLLVKEVTDEPQPLR
jgi:hypothetical protein